jgi:hypothetical protein
MKNVNEIEFFSDKVFDGYRLSYLWYAPLGWIITMVVGMIASALLGGVDPDTLDPALLIPVVRKIFIKVNENRIIIPIIFSLILLK